LEWILWISFLLCWKSIKNEIAGNGAEQGVPLSLTKKIPQDIKIHSKLHRSIHTPKTLHNIIHKWKFLMKGNYCNAKAGSTIMESNRTAWAKCYYIFFCLLIACWIIIFFQFFFLFGWIEFYFIFLRDWEIAGKIFFIFWRKKGYCFWEVDPN
jgi:hypothetical protein